MSELAVLTEHVPHPVTGEVLDLSDVAAVARHLSQLRELRSRVNEATSLLNDALAAHAQQHGTKTLHVEGVGKVVLTGGPGSVVVWDIEILQMLLDAGLPQDRYDELVTETVSYKVNASVAKSIAGANPAYAEIVEAARGTHDRAWIASVR